MAASALRRFCGTCCNGKFRLLRVHRSNDNESLRTNTHPLKWTGSLNSLSRRLDQGVFQYPNLLSNGSPHHGIEPNRDSRLSGSWRHDRTSPGFTEIVLPFHLRFLDDAGAEPTDPPARRPV